MQKELVWLEMSNKDSKPPQERIDCFAEYGFDTLIIWENELSNPSNLKDKLMAFDAKHIGLT